MRLRAQPAPITLTALAAASGLHPNTVRDHLTALVQDGLVTRRPAEPHGRGRPAWLYEATGEVAGGSEYAGLASALASVIHHGSRNPRGDAIAAGTAWGRELARDRETGPAGSAASARARVVGLLDQIGFAPEADGGSVTVRLTRCPLLDAAHKYPDVVCGVHLGIVRGALAEYGADRLHSDLFPFVEPGACRLELREAAGGDDGH